MLIAFDLSTTKTGFAFGSPRDSAPACGAWKLPGADDDVFDRTLSTLAESVGALCRTVKPQWAVIEKPLVISNRSAHTMVALMQLTGAARAAAARAGCRIRLIPPQTVRKHFVGNGFPENPKQAVMDRCRMLRWDVEDDNAADACACWSWGISTLYRAGVHTAMFKGAET